MIAVAARSLDKAEEFIKKHEIERAYGSYEELAKDEEVQVNVSTTILSIFVS